MLDAKGIKTPEAKGKTPEPKEVSSKEALPKLYTQAEADALVHAAKSETGRRLKEIEVERDSLKAQILSKDNALEDIQDEIKSAKQQIDELTSDDPAKFDLVKKQRELREQERQIKADKSAIEQEKESLKPAQETKREVEIWEVASSFEDGDPIKLKALADSFEAKSKERYQQIAEILGWKPKGAEVKTEPEIEPMKPYPGLTEGGAHSLGNLPPKDMLKEIEKQLTQ